MSSNYEKGGLNMKVDVRPLTSVQSEVYRLRKLIKLTEEGEMVYQNAEGSGPAFSRWWGEGTVEALVEGMGGIFVTVKKQQDH